MATEMQDFLWGSDPADKVSIEWDPAVKSQPIKVYTTANTTGSSRVMNITVAPNNPGNRATIVIEQQGEDEIVSTTYGPLKFRGFSATCNGSVVEGGYTFIPGRCDLTISFGVYKDRTDVYSSGKTVVTEVESFNDPFFLGGDLLSTADSSVAYRRLLYADPAGLSYTNGAATTVSAYFAPMDYLVAESDEVSFVVASSEIDINDAHDKVLSGPNYTVATPCVQDANLITEVKGGTKESWNEPTLLASAASSALGIGSFKGRYVYTSGAEDPTARFLPVRYEVFQTNWLAITSQNPNYSATESSVSVRSTAANTTSTQRTGYLSAYSNDTSNTLLAVVSVFQSGSGDKTTVTIMGILQSSATGGLPTLRLTAFPQAPASTLEVTVSVINKTSGSRVETYSIASGSSAELYTLSDGDTRVSIVDVSPTEDSSCTYTF